MRINENYFDVIDTPMKAYWLGVLIGRCYKKIPEYGIDLRNNRKEDLSWFCTLKKELNLTNKVYNKSKYGLWIPSKHLVNKISYYKKSIHEIGLNDKKLLLYFIKGYFDWRGGIYLTTEHRNKKSIKLTITGTETLINKIKNILEEYTSLKNVAINKYNGIYLQGFYKVYDFYTDIYSLEGITRPFISNRFHNILKEKRESYKNRNYSRRHRIVSLDNNYFEQINSPDKAYFLGLLMADGCTYKNKKYDTYIVELTSIDKDIIDKFKKAISSGHKIIKKLGQQQNICGRICNKQTSYTIKFSNKKLVEDLIKLGVKPRKSLKEIFPDISEQFYPDFIRGYFDGDGCVCISNKYNKLRIEVIFYGSNEVCRKIQEVLIKACSLKKNKIRYNSNNKLYSFGYSGRHQVEKIYRYLYYSPNVVAINRKKNIFEEFLKNT